MTKTAMAGGNPAIRNETKEEAMQLTVDDDSDAEVLKTFKYSTIDPLYDNELDEADEEYLKSLSMGGEKASGRKKGAKRKLPHKRVDRSLLHTGRNNTTEEKDEIKRGNEDNRRSNEDDNDEDHLTPVQSDGHLSCPACFTPLCCECQRHERYHTQFRAIFVMNVALSEKDVLRVPAESEASTTEEIFKPVICAHCGLDVAVLDGNEVYHFFHVLHSR